VFEPPEPFVELSPETLKSLLSSAIEHLDKEEAIALDHEARDLGNRVGKPTGYERAILKSNLTHEWERGLATLALGFRLAGLAITGCTASSGGAAYSLALVETVGHSSATVKIYKAEFEAAAQSLHAGLLSEFEEMAPVFEQVVGRKPTRLPHSDIRQRFDHLCQSIKDKSPGG